MTTEPPVSAKPPGFLWVVLLGLAGFCAGFFGPLVFVPEANQGPLVGIFLTGPGGAALGLLLWLLMKLRPLPGRSQWILLSTVAAAGTLAICYFVQPQPATRGYELEFTLERSSSPGEAADAIIADWKTRIARVTWAAPRPGWETQMRTALAADPGRVLETVLIRKRAIKEHRKPWNRGRLFATPWESVQEKKRYYLRPDAPLPALTSAPVRLFLRHDSSAPIRAPDVWPPLEPAEFIGYSRLEAVPAEYATLP
ncbi:MAG TPA: hypothetical protein VG734_16250 [Lacunisphaera sp.]|nr:hypothetical protein [Lacunisphaera sp.]